MLKLNAYILDRPFKKAIAALASLILSSHCLAQSLELPAVHTGDSWRYVSTVERGPSGWTQTRDDVIVTRVTGSTIYFSQKQSGSTEPARDVYAGTDWSRIRDVNGKEMVVGRPLSFPMSIGKSWTVQYTEQHPNKNHKSEQWDNKFTVVGYENVDVPAGKFHALKIECEGHWTAELEPAQSVVQGARTSDGTTSMVTEVNHTVPGSTSGRIYKALWYVPEVKRWVKSVDEYYSSGGVRNERYTNELVSFTPAGTPPQ